MIKAKLVSLTHKGADPQIAHIVDTEDQTASWTMCGEPVNKNSQLIGENTLLPMCKECIDYLLFRAESYRKEAQKLEDLHSLFTQMQDGEQ